MSYPAVSVIIPAYNRSQMLRRAIQSVFNQTYQDFELIVVDDASEDNTEEVVRRFQDQRIRYIRHEENTGGSAARNTGVKVACGEYIAFLDSDDEWLPEKLEKQMAKIKTASPSVGFVYSGFTSISGKTGKTLNRHIPQTAPNVYGHALEANGSSLLAKKECFQRIGLFDVTLASCQDWDMAIRLSQQYDLDFVPEALVKYYFHGAQISNSLEKKIQGREALIGKHYEGFIKYPSLLANHYSRQAILYVLAGNKIKARDFFLRSIRLKPMQRYAYAQLILLLITPRRYAAGLKRKHTTAEGLQFFW